MHALTCLRFVHFSNQATVGFEGNDASVEEWECLDSKRYQCILDDDNQAVTLPLPTRRIVQGTANEASVRDETDKFVEHLFEQQKRCPEEKNMDPLQVSIVVPENLQLRREYKMHNWDNASDFKTWLVDIYGEEGRDDGIGVLMIKMVKDEGNQLEFRCWAGQHRFGSRKKLEQYFASDTIGDMYRFHSCQFWVGLQTSTESFLSGRHNRASHDTLDADKLQVRCGRWCGKCPWYVALKREWDGKWMDGKYYHWYESESSSQPNLCSNSMCTEEVSSESSFDDRLSVFSFLEDSSSDYSSDG